MKRAVWLGMGIALGAAMSAGAQGLLGPMGRFEAGLLDDLSWKSRCMAPNWPSAGVATDFEISRAKTDWDLYRDCVVRRAKSDAAFASKAVYDAAVEEIEDEKRTAAGRGWRFN